TGPLEPAVVSVTSVHGGSTHNIVPESVELLGTVRTHGDAVRELLKDRLPRYVKAVAEANRGSAEFEFTNGVPALVNDPEKPAQFKEVATQVLGAENVLEMEPVMGSEDM